MLKMLIKIVMMLLWRWWCRLFGVMVFGLFYGGKEMYHSINHRIYVQIFVVVVAIVGVVTFVWIHPATIEDGC